MMAQILRERLCSPDDAVQILRDLLNCPADLVPDHDREILRVRLHAQFPEGCLEAIRHLCSELVSAEISFPATSLRMIYEVAHPA